MVMKYCLIFLFVFLLISCLNKKEKANEYYLRSKSEYSGFSMSKGMVDSNKIKFETAMKLIDSAITFDPLNGYYRLEKVNDEYVNSEFQNYGNHYASIKQFAGEINDIISSTDKDKTFR